MRDEGLANRYGYGSGLSSEEQKAYDQAEWGNEGKGECRRDATEKWADCMADGGYPGLEQSVDATNLVETQVAPIIRDENGYPVPNPDPRRLKEVQDFELAIAGVDFTCTQQHVEPVRRVRPAAWPRNVKGIDMSCVRNVVGVLAAIALLGGCTSTEDSGADDSLANYIGFSPLGDEHDLAVRAAKSLQYTDEEKKRTRAVEDFVASCMREQGFEYVPQYLEDLEDDPPGGYEIQASMSREEFAKQYGYGNSTLTFANKPQPNPNLVIEEGLSPEARQAYQKAQFGEDGGGGCRAKADKEVGGDTYSELEQIANEFKDLQEDISRLQQRLPDDPRMRDATKKWADCMADGGYPGLEEATDAMTLIDDRMAPITTVGPGKLVEPVDQKKLKEVQDFELAIAGVDFACTQEHVAPVRKEVVTRLEQQFVAEHKAELERFRDRAGDSGYQIAASA